MRTILRKTMDVLGSFGLATVLLVLMMVLTYLGTIEQNYSTLYEVQTTYFQSFFVVHYIDGRFPLPLPGAYLLLALLFVNLLLGGLLRMRRGKSTLGVFVVHFGIVILLAGCFVEDRLSTKGAMKIWEPAPGLDHLDVTDEYRSLQDWEVAIVRYEADGSTTEFVIPHDEFADLGEGDSVRCRAADLPFDIVLSDYMRNSRPTSAPPGKGVGGVVLEPLEPVGVNDTGADVDYAGLRVALVEKGSDRKEEGLLWAGSAGTSRFSLGGRSWSLDLRQRTWPLPFEIRLDRFVHEVHPGTGMSRRFSSFVTLKETHGGEPTERQVHITMNRPLRHRGYTLYQSEWGPKTDEPAQRSYSILAVVDNPCDQVPLIACIIIAVGLLLHFGRKLTLYLKAESRRRITARSSS